MRYSPFPPEAGQGLAGMMLKNVPRLIPLSHTVGQAIGYSVIQRKKGPHHMAVKLKKLRDQVIVITGATSGIGLTTARMAARRGARLVLAARSDQALVR